MSHSKPIVDFSASMASINLARLASLRDHSANPQAGFQTQRHRVTTAPNGANITIAFPGEEFLRTYLNKCFVHSVFDGLSQYKLVWQGYSPFNLMCDIGFDKTMLMFDTSNNEHIRMINRLFQQFENLRLEFYIGTKEGDQWFTTQTPHAVFGTGEYVIRILNQNGNHFEYIIDQEMPPIQHMTEEQQMEAFQRQLQILQQLEMDKMKKEFASKMTLVTDVRMEPSGVHSGDIIDSKQQIAGAQVNLSSSSSSSSSNPVSSQQPMGIDQSMAAMNAVTEDGKTITKPEEKKEPEKTDEEIAREIQAKLEQEEKDEEYARKVHYGLVD